MKEFRPETRLTPRCGSIIGIIDLIFDFTLNAEMSRIREWRQRGQKESQETKYGNQEAVRDSEIQVEEQSRTTKSSGCGTWSGNQEQN